MSKSWQMPRFDAPESTRLGYLDDFCSDGENWNKSQPGFTDWKRSLEIMNGQTPVRDAGEFKDYVSGRRLRTNIRTSAAGLANIRPIWGYHAPKDFEKYAMAWNKTSRALYLEGFWGRDIKDCLSYAMATNTGFIRPVYRRGMAGIGRGKIQLLTYGQPCVLPSQMPSSGDYQEAYVVSLLDEMPIFEAHSRWPLFQDLLKPTNSQYWYASEIRGAAENNAQKRWWNPFKPKGDKKDPSRDLYIPIRYTTIIDVSVNDSGQTIPMGQPGTPWYYEVPSYGSVIGVTEGGSEIKAGEDDARMYPYRRQIISSEACIMYDGPAFNWHGELDLISMTVDKWPWAPGGFSMVHDAYGIEKQLNALDSGIMRRIKAQNNPPLGYSIDQMTKLEAESFDPMDTDNIRIGYDASEGDDGPPLKPLVPFEFYKIFPEQLAYRTALIEDIDYTMQMRDIVELSKAKALGKDMEAMEKVLSSLGPIVRDIGVGMEESLGQVGHQIGYLIPQYMTSSRMISYIGAESVPEGVYDYNPNDLYPSHLPDEQIHGEDDHAMKKSRYTTQQRARWMAEKIRFVTIPGSIHQVHQMATVLTELQMKQRGMQISDYSVMSAAGIPNIVPPDGNSEQQMWESEQEDKVRFQARMAVITQTIAGEQHLGGPPGAPQPGGGGKGKGGRPPTAQAAPKLEQKGDGRTVISESK